MGRCEVCGRKNNPAWRWCGKTKCLNEDRIIPRCIKCNNLMYEGKTGLCPNDKQACVLPSDGEGNAKKVWSKTDYLEVV